MATSTDPVKPALRGVSHEIAAFVAFVATIALAWWAGARGRTAAIVYGLGLTLMYSVSALYHRPTWRPAVRQWMRRLDHSTIFVLIAATYTPIGVLLVPKLGSTVLVVAWVGAALGALRVIFWLRAPKVVAVGLYIALGWLGLLILPPLATQAGALAVVMLAVGGIIYSAGAVVYARKRPDPIPSVFGYHEVFHLLVIVASVCHFVCEVRVLDRLQ